jgi:hypothetical protein
MKIKIEHVRAVAIGLSVALIGITAYLWNRPWAETGITSLYTLIIVLLFIFLIAMIQTEAGEKRQNFNAVFLLITSIGALLFVVVR